MNENEKEGKNPRVVIIGCGGAGCNSLTRMHEIGLEHVETIAINTDTLSLELTRAEKKVLIGKHTTKGFGTGRNMNLGETVALDALDDMREIIGKPEMVFIVAGLGGGTGGGALPVIARLCKSLGAVVVAIVTMPFRSEGRISNENAEKALRDIRNSVDYIAVGENDSLLKVASRRSIHEAFLLIDRIIRDIVYKMVDGIHSSIIAEERYTVHQPVMNVELNTKNVEVLDGREMMIEMVSNIATDLNYEFETINNEERMMIRMESGESRKERKQSKIMDSRWGDFVEREVDKNGL